MSVVLLDRAAQGLRDLGDRDAGRVGEATRQSGAGPHLAQRRHARGGCTLDQLVTLRWRSLAGGESVQCPVCDGQMAPHRDGAVGTSGRCLQCGTTLV